MVKKLLAVSLAVASFSSYAATQATITVQGKITPSICAVTVADPILDYGNLVRSTIKTFSDAESASSFKDTDITLGASKATSVKVTCPANSVVGLKVTTSSRPALATSANMVIKDGTVSKHSGVVSADSVLDLGGGVSGAIYFGAPSLQVAGADGVLGTAVVQKIGQGATVASISADATANDGVLWNSTTSYIFAVDATATSVRTPAKAFDFPLSLGASMKKTAFDNSASDELSINATINVEVITL